MVNLKNSTVSTMRIMKKRLTASINHLHAGLIHSGVTLSDYQKIEDLIVSVFRIEKSGHLLTWARSTTNLILSLKKLEAGNINNIRKRQKFKLVETPKNN